MNIYKNGSINIHTIKPNDQDQCLRIYSEQNQGYNNIRSIYEEGKIMQDVIDKKTIATQYIVMEENGQVIGYACINRPDIETYYIEHIRMNPRIMSEKYEVFFLDVIKREAIQDYCSIVCDENVLDEGVLIRSGFYKNFNQKFFLSNKEMSTSIGQQLVPLFRKFEIIQKELNKKQKIYQKIRREG